MDFMTNSQHQGHEFGVLPKGGLDWKTEWKTELKDGMENGTENGKVVWKPY